MFHNLYNKLCVGVYEAGNDHGNRFQKAEQIFDEWAAHGQPTVMFWDCKNSPDLYELDKKRPCIVCMKLLEVHELDVLT